MLSYTYLQVLSNYFRFLSADSFKITQIDLHLLHKVTSPSNKIYSRKSSEFANPNQGWIQGVRGRDPQAAMLLIANNTFKKLTDEKDKYASPKSSSGSAPDPNNS